MKQAPVMLAMALALMVTNPPAARAQETDFYPPLAAFNGKDALLLSPSPALDINGFGTIEFWVKANWTQDPGYDPAIMAYTGPKGARFGFYLDRAAKALGVQAGPYYETVEFDFSDKQLHHVAISSIGDTTTVMIDGEIQDTLGFSFANLPATSFSIGSAGRFSPFIGEIGQVRIWNEVIDPDVLVDFSWREMAESGPNRHPDIDALVGVSAFANPETGGFIFAGDPDDPEIVATMNAGFERTLPDLAALGLIPPGEPASSEPTTSSATAVAP
ncbi:LamG domain-containing protein [Novosphingobium sp.]|uniref:LamG domain-containing protein n=1 Tax=Novosphingobium sp. TaxID=1874826 RepID=UPI00263821F2|nr:LamG domain-containing protein [Novosphingobium sp.]